MSELFGYWLIAISILGLVYCIGNIIRALTQSNPYSLTTSDYDFFYVGLSATHERQKVKSVE